MTAEPKAPRPALRFPLGDPGYPIEHQQGDHAMTDHQSTALPPRRPWIEVYPHDTAPGADPQHGWRLKAGNGEIVAHGEGYGDPADAEAMALKIVVDHRYDTADVVRIDATGKVRHELTDRNAPRPTVIPEALSSEDGDRWWAVGHVAPMAMVLAVLVEQATHVGPEEAGRLLVKLRLDHEQVATQADNQAETARLVDQVRHYWCKPDPDHDERMLDCDGDDPAAEAWTELAL